MNHHFIPVPARSSLVKTSQAAASKLLRRLGVALLLWSTTALAQTESIGAAAWVAESKLDNSGAETELPEQALLAIGLLTLDLGVSSHTASKERLALRQAEALYIPFLLRTVLENTRLWGPVRVLPSSDPTAELLITGTIVESSGERLVVQLSAIDSTGRQWLDQQYVATAQLADYETPGTEPFLSLYQQIAADLSKFRATLELRDLDRIIQVSRLAYAAVIAPEAFDNYLKRQANGRLVINRLPAVGDPMLARVERTRETEYLFIDAVDLQFGQYFRDLAPTYAAWRRLTLESQTLMASYRKQARSKRSSKGKKSAARSYRELQELKLYQQTLREAMVSFRFEVGPTTLDLDGEIIELSGSLAEQQIQWKSLLSQIYAEQVGLPLISDSAE